MVAYNVVNSHSLDIGIALDKIYGICQLDADYPRHPNEIYGRFLCLYSGLVCGTDWS